MLCTACPLLRVLDNAVMAAFIEPHAPALLTRAHQLAMVHQETHNRPISEEMLSEALRMDIQEPFAMMLPSLSP